MDKYLELFSVLPEITNLPENAPSQYHIIWFTKQAKLLLIQLKKIIHWSRIYVLLGKILQQIQKECQPPQSCSDGIIRQHKDVLQNIVV